jgi:serine phosphatase RsbU (regulator of sigma subunit)
MKLDATALTEIPWFAALDEEARAAVATALTRVEAAPGTLFFREGDSGDHFAFIASGEVDIFRQFEDGEERMLQTLRPGDTFGEMGLLRTSGRRTAGARARTDVVLFTLQRENFDRLLEQRPTLAVHFMRQAAERLFATENNVVADLRASNRRLAQAYRELKMAQAQLIEQEKLQHELTLARTIQESMLPKTLPALPGYAIEVIWQPAQAVGGDFYDLLPLQDGRLACMIGDVTGKGVPAALVMSTTVSLLRALCEEHTRPGQLLASVNRHLCTTMPGKMFVTCQVILLNPESGCLRLANAGHSAPLLCTENEAVPLRARGMPLGLFADAVYDEVDAQLLPGGSLVLHTDGVVETRNASGAMYGIARFTELLLACRSQRSLAEGLMPALLAFGNGAAEEDITLVRLHRGDEDLSPKQD